MATHRVTRRPDAGFTLIEVMIAILLTAIAVLGMIALFRVETQAGAASRRQTEAAVLAQDKLEALRTRATPLVGEVVEIGLDANGMLPQNANPPSPPGPYTRTSKVDPAGANLKLTVTVSWDDGARTRDVIVHGLRGAL
jgi:prepilin-type N-terminal cleavage/methylation domain-containing protein